MIELITHAIILAVSLAALAGVSHFTIKSVEDLMEATGLSEASTGFVVLAWMTSMPEVIVAVFAIYQGTPGITVGDILGSNVFNIGIVIGIMAILGSLKACRTELLTELVDILFLSSLIPLLLVMFKVASPLVGVILLGIYAFSVYKMTKKRISGTLIPGIQKPNKMTIIAKVVAGIIVVILAARFAVSSASHIAYLLGIPPILIGAKIIAIGTSLPELALDLTAAKRGRVELAIGDVIGSNLTNITLVLGFVLLASPFAVNITTFTEILPFVLVTTLILWRCLTKGGISPTGGIVLVIVYILFQAIL